MIDGTKPADAKGLAGLLRNPLVVFGLVLLAGDGPLVVAYARTSEPSMAVVLMWATILFIFGMGGFFCYLVACKPRNLYAPDQIPEGVIDKPLYHEPTTGKDVLKEAQDLVQSLTVSESENQRKSIAQNINARLQIANEVQTAYELLLIPGYDISVILDILEDIDTHARVDHYAIADPRNITPSTVETIVASMGTHNFISGKRGKYYLTESGKRLMNSLREYLNTRSKGGGS